MATARSTRFGAAITGLLFAVGVGVAALAVGTLRVALLLAAVGALLGVVISFRRRASPAAQAAAAILVPAAAVAMTVGIGLVLAGDLDPTALAGAGLPIALLLALAALAVPSSIAVGALVGGLGVVVTLRSEVDGEGLAQVIGTALFTMVLLGMVLGTSLALRFASGEAVLAEWLAMAAAVGTAATDAIGPADPVTGLLTFFVLLTAAGAAGVHALRTVPGAELAPSAYRSYAERGIELAQRVTMGAAVVGLFGAILLVMTADTGAIEPPVSAGEPLRRVVLALGSDGLQWPLVLLTIGFAAVSASIGLLQRLTGGVTSLLQRVVPASAGAVVVIGVAAVVPADVVAALRALGRATPEPIPALLGVLDAADLVLAAAALALAVLVCTLVGLIALTVVGLVPNRSLGGVLVGAGLGLGGVAVALDGGSPVLVYGLLGLGVLSWDVSDRSGRAAADLHGGRGPSVAVELLHWLTSAGVALAAVLAALGLLAVVQGVRPLPVTEFTLAALAAVAAAVVLLVAVIRG